MTADECYASALALCGVERAQETSLDALVPDWINAALADFLSVENSLRSFKGAAPLEQAQRIAALTDPLCYQPELLATALIYRLAAHYSANERDEYREQCFDAMSASALSKLKKCMPGVIEDVYGGTE